MSPNLNDDDTRRLSEALQLSDMGVFEFHPQTRQAYWGQGVGDIWGFAASQKITYDLLVGQIHKDDLAKHSSYIENLLDPKGLKQLHIEYRIFPLDGGPMRWVHIIAKSSFENDMPVRLIGNVKDVTLRREYLNRNTLLTHELQHRVKNTLAMVLSIAKLSNTGEKTAAEFIDSLEDRILSMAETHNILRRSDWNNVDIRSLVEVEFKAFVGPKKDSLNLTGGELIIPAHQVKIFAMAIHELLTNSIKHGALRTDSGYVNVHISHEDGVGKFVWTEKNGNNLNTTGTPEGGFGSFLLQNILPAQLKGSAIHEISTDGALFSLEFPLPHPVNGST